MWRQQVIRRYIVFKTYTDEFFHLQRTRAELFKLWMKRSDMSDMSVTRSEPDLDCKRLFTTG